MIVQQLASFNFPARLKPDLSPFFILIVAAFLLASCATRPPSVIQDGDFEQSEDDAEYVLSQLSYYGSDVNTLEGRARARISEPGVSEQATVSFVSDRTRSLLSFRNSLGVEGGRIFSDRDSVTFYDRIEQRAWITDIETSRTMLLSGFTAFNLIDFLLPEFDPEDVSGIYENSDSWLLLFDDFRQVVISKSGGEILQMTFLADDPDIYNTFRFEHHARLSGIVMPRSIRILSNDGKSNIFLMIQALEVNPSDPSFDIRIPNDIVIEKL